LGDLAVMIAIIKLVEKLVGSTSPGAPSVTR